MPESSLQPNATAETIDTTAGKRLTAEQIEESIRNAVLHHKLPPGTKLGEIALGELYGVSRTVIKRALTGLTKEGLVCMPRGRGAHVAKPTIDDAREAFEMRQLLEGDAVRKLIETVTPEKIHRLRQHLQKEQEATEQNDLGRSYALRNDFHRLLAEMSDSALLAEMLQLVLGRSKLIVILYGTSSTPECTCGDHLKLVEQIEQRDAEAATATMATHLQTLQNSLDLNHDKSATSNLQSLLGADPIR